LEQKQHEAVENQENNVEKLEQITKATETRFEEKHLKPLRAKQANIEETIK
jgi:hypothetical protein